MLNVLRRYSLPNNSTEDPVRMLGASVSAFTFQGSRDCGQIKDRAPGADSKERP